MTQLEETSEVAEMANEQRRPGGRPRFPDDVRRDKNLLLRFNQEERDLLDAVSEQPSVWARAAVLDAIAREHGYESWATWEAESK